VEIFAIKELHRVEGTTPIDAVVVDLYDLRMGELGENVKLASEQ
jgi:hypothetical protein